MEFYLCIDDVKQDNVEIKDIAYMSLLIMGINDDRKF